jgi:hypothetical protein
VRAERPQLRGRFWIETALASLTSLLLGLTLLWPEWIEAMGLEPDHGNGSWEWTITLGLAAVTVISAVRARLEWRRSLVRARQVVGGVTGA